MLDKGSQRLVLSRPGTQEDLLNLDHPARGSFTGEMEEDSTIEMALCLSLIKQQKYANSMIKIFSEHILTFEDFSQDPIGIVQNPEFVIRVEDKFYDF